MILYNNPNLRKITEDLYSEEYFLVNLKVLVGFFEDSEEGILLEKLNCLDEFSCHSILDFIIKNEHIQSFKIYKDVLDVLYRINKCSLCRNDIFLKMCEFSFMDKNTCKEAFFDANIETSEKAKEYYKEKFA